jgi:hypothetical protein
MEDVGIFMTIWSILLHLGILYFHLVYFMVNSYFFPFLVCCTKKYLAILVSTDNWPADLIQGRHLQS